MYGKVKWWRMYRTHLSKSTPTVVVTHLSKFTQIRRSHSSAENLIEKFDIQLLYHVN